MGGLKLLKLIKLVIRIYLCYWSVDMDWRRLSCNQPNSTSKSLRFVKAVYWDAFIVKLSTGKHRAVPASCSFLLFLSLNCSQSAKLKDLCTCPQDHRLPVPGLRGRPRGQVGRSDSHGGRRQRAHVSYRRDSDISHVMFSFTSFMRHLASTYFRYL